MKKEKFEYEVSSGNVFADLGFKNPEELLAKAELTRQIHILIKKKKLTKSTAAKLLEVDQQTIDDLNSGSFADFSLDSLFRFLNMLGQNINIDIAPNKKTKKKAQININLSIVKKKKIIIPKRNPSSNAVPIHAKKRSSLRPRLRRTAGKALEKK